MLTGFRNPHKALTDEELRKLTARIPRDQYQDLFLSMFTTHGATSNIVAALLEKFHEACLAANIPTYYTPHNEETAQKLLDSITFDTSIKQPEYKHLIDNSTTDLNHVSEY